MPRYEHPDVSFDVPRDWEDRSVAAFSAPLPPGKTTGPNVVLTRDKLEPGENLASYADRNLVELAQRLEKFSLVKRSDLTVSDLPAVELRFTWKGAGGPPTPTDLNTKLAELRDNPRAYLPRRLVGDVTIEKKAEVMSRQGVVGRFGVTRHDGRA